MPSNSILFFYQLLDEGPVADRLHADLQNKGVRCWFAPHDLPIGAKTWDAIDEAIRLRDKLLLILSKRRETVEQPFGSIKQWMNQGAFLMLGLEKVRGEFSLTALAYNLKRVLSCTRG